MIEYMLTTLFVRIGEEASMNGLNGGLTCTTTYTIGFIIENYEHVTSFLLQIVRLSEITCEKLWKFQPQQK